jgi:hypothetical protein
VLRHALLTVFGDDGRGARHFSSSRTQFAKELEKIRASLFVIYLCERDSEDVFLDTTHLLINSSMRSLPWAARSCEPRDVLSGVDVRVELAEIQQVPKYDRAEVFASEHCLKTGPAKAGHLSPCTERLLGQTHSTLHFLTLRGRPLLLPAFFVST